MMISIAMTSYNGEKFISEQISSILSQTIEDFELIICDDCSTDHTLSILKEYKEKDSRIKIIQNKNQLGFLKNFEQAISLCTGDYIACSDQDDIWTNNHLEYLLNNIGENDCIGANGIIIDNLGKKIGSTVKESLSVEYEPSNSDSLFKHECFYNLIQGTACLFKKTLLSSILPFPDGIKFHDHWIALNAAMQNGCKYTSDIILHYRTHSQNVTGFRKFNLVHSLKTAIQANKYRHQIYRHNIAMLKSIKCKNAYNDVYVNKALVFFENLSSDKQRIRSILFYIKNYNEIALCPRKKWKLFLYRVFCLSLFGIML